MPNRTNKRLSPSRYTVSITGTRKDHYEDEKFMVRVNFFDENDPQIFAKKLPIKSKSAILKNSYYAIRDVSTGEYAIPLDDVFNSTKMSSDAEGMYFILDTSSLVPQREYVIDVSTKVDGIMQKYLDVSSTFRIRKRA